MIAISTAKKERHVRLGAEGAKEEEEEDEDVVDLPPPELSCASGVTSLANNAWPNEDALICARVRPNEEPS
jgi:hypothetical protein